MKCFWKEIPLFVNAVVTKVNEKDGKVTGVNVTIGKENSSAKAVVLTTGGFDQTWKWLLNKPELKALLLQTKRFYCWRNCFVKELGAATVDMKDIQIHLTVEQSTSALISESVRGEGAILVNQDGKRFYNEMETRDKSFSTNYWIKRKYAYLVFDSALAER